MRSEDQFAFEFLVAPSPGELKTTTFKFNFAILSLLKKDSNSNDSFKD